MGPCLQKGGGGSEFSCMAVAAHRWAYTRDTAVHTGATIWVFYIGIFSGGLVLLTVFNITPGGVAWWRSCYCG